MVSALDFLLGAPVQVVLAGKIGETRALAREVFARYAPNRIVLHLEGGEGEEFLAASVPSLRGMGPIDGKPAAYVCRDFVCTMPTTETAVLGRLLDDAVDPGGLPTLPPGP